MEQAGETLRAERARYLQGRSTTNDLLEAEAQLYERQTMLELARLEIVQAWIRLSLVSGIPLEEAGFQRLVIRLSTCLIEEWYVGERRKASPTCPFSSSDSPNSSFSAIIPKNFF